MILSEVKESIDKLIEKFGQDKPINFFIYDSNDCDCREVTLNFEVESLENDQIIIMGLYEELSEED